MPDDQIMDAKELINQVRAFHQEMKERRRHERKSLLWAATVEVRGQRFEGTIVDFSAGGARIKFDAAVCAGEELTLVLKQLDELGAKVVWQREGEAGLKFLLAPEEVAARVNSKLSLSLDASNVEPARTCRGHEVIEAEPDNAPRLPARTQSVESAAPLAEPRRGLTKLPLVVLLAIGSAVLVAAIGGSVVMANGGGDEAPPGQLAVTVGDFDQHSCAGLMGKVNGATNQVDFSLHVAKAVQAKCLDLQRIGSSPDNDLSGHMLQATKVR